MKYGQTIYNLRKSSGFSQEKVAEELQVTRQSISLWETDQASPTIENLLLLSKLFNVSIDDIVNNNASKLDSSDRVIKVEYLENKKTLFIIKSYLQIILLLIYPISYLLVFSIIDFINYFSSEINNTYSIVLRIGLPALIIALLIAGVILIHRSYKKTLSENRRFEYQFGSDNVIVRIFGISKSETEFIEYDNIKKVYETRSYLLVNSSNTLYYIPKNDEYSSIYELFKGKQIKISQYSGSPSAITISKSLCIILPLLSLASTMLIAGLVTEPSDLLLWVLFVAVPIATIIHGKYSIKIIRKIYSIPSIVIGSLCLLMDLIGFIVIFIT